MDSINLNYREIILCAAKSIAENEGITKINIRAVAKGSGIAIGTVYNYFPSKGDLLVAVIEDFWDGAFANVDWKSLSQNNFYDNLEKIYNILYEYLNKFRENWLEQLSILKTQEKQLGKQRQNEYFARICEKIKVLIDMDSELRQYSWDHVISKEKMAEYIFENMIMMLRKNEKELSFFIAILKKILSK
ncbi:TetR/AcrR family transcriptional regulator [Clostridium sp.]|uniref:TetR/AcrR family transcriptional regulator n=1 Tax=Clostridium sp. TaxID=1506 RepID=UPI002FCC76A9